MIIKLPVPKHILSKSTFMYGVQCPKRLWLHKNLPSEKDEPDQIQTAIFQQGTDVGLLARNLFSSGVDASPSKPYLYQQSVADTARYLRQGCTIIYEAAFQYKGILCALDILVKQNDKWFAYEVKATNSIKSAHIQDAALQYYAITNAGLDLEDFSVIHLNRKYIRNGDLNLSKLFTLSSVLNEVKERQPFIAVKVNELISVLELKMPPVIEMSPHCNLPYPCDFQGFCSNGIKQLETCVEGKINNKEAVQIFTNGLEYPVYFLDFESWMTAVPQYDGHWPYRQICYQFSVHVQQESGASSLSHFSYLAEGTHSPQLEFIENLLTALGNKGSIVLYPHLYADQRFHEFKDEFPHLKEAIFAVQQRKVNMPPSLTNNYSPSGKDDFTFRLGSSFFAIHNSADAAAAFYNLKEETDQQKIALVRAALIKYGEASSLAMAEMIMC